MIGDVIGPVRAARDAFAADHGHELKRVGESLRQTMLELRNAGVELETGPSGDPAGPANPADPEHSDLH